VSFPGGQWWTLPATCAHGMAWSLPCAACGRPYQPAPEVIVDAAAVRELTEAVRALTDVLRQAAEDRERP
jgi:hypothetical protein